jgi:hypothetical protein
VCGVGVMFLFVDRQHRYFIFTLRLIVCFQGMRRCRSSVCENDYQAWQISSSAKQDSQSASHCENGGCQGTRGSCGQTGLQTQSYNNNNANANNKQTLLKQQQWLILTTNKTLKTTTTTINNNEQQQQQQQ